MKIIQSGAGGHDFRPLATAAARNATKSAAELELAAVLYSNRAAALLACGQSEAALVDARRAISLRPAWPKGYLRAARARVTR